jgi:diguanylate cyclase (GGDEF)-like protein
MSSKIWEYFENLNEIVYVADIDTHDIVYMNRKAMQEYGFESDGEYQQKKCYEVFQGNPCPCSICTNEELVPGQFKEWTFYNPILHKLLSLKDSLIEEDGRRYRMEMAIDMSVREKSDEAVQDYIDNEAMINDGLKISLSVSDPDESIDLLLKFLGTALGSERAYIFEKQEGEYFCNTYEWCADGVQPQKENLQNTPPEVVKIWLERFNRNENVVIRDLEETRQTDPAMYDYLYPQDIHSLVASPLIYRNHIIGFYGVDNPPGDLLGNISTLFEILGHFIVSLLRRRNLVKRLEHLSYHDQLTGFRNRHGMDHFLASLDPEQSIGIVYGDVTGLKQINDTKGHQAGDILLLQACESMKRVFGDYPQFRMGGDEFLILCDGISEAELMEKAELLREDMAAHSVSMAIGCKWYPDSREDMDQLLAEAEQLMYQDKREYYDKAGGLERE